MTDSNGKYATQADLIAEYGDTVIKQLADRDGDGVVDASVLKRVWARVDGEIDGYLAKAGYTPNTGDKKVPMLSGIAVDLAYAKLHTGKLSDLAKDRRDNAEQKLKDIARGTLKLGLPDDGKGAVSAPASLRTMGSVKKASIWKN